MGESVYDGHASFPYMAIYANKLMIISSQASIHMTFFFVDQFT